MLELDKRLRLYRLAFVFLLASASASAQTEQKQNGALPEVSRVLLVSIDGFHSANLANYIQSNPGSTLAQLSGIGVTYTNASTSRPSDSIPGFLAQITGGTPRTTGLWYEVSYRRDLSPPDSNCKTVGTVVYVDDEIDADPRRLDGGGINVGLLPRDPKQNCAPVFPHQLLRVNTVFEVVHAHDLKTAWADKHLAYEFAHGPSGKGVDDLYTPEIAAINPDTGNDWAGTLSDVEKYDDFKVQAVLDEMNGLDHSGKVKTRVPTLFGMNFQALHIAQKHAADPVFGKGGYIDTIATPGPLVSEALRFVDSELGKMVGELKQNGLFDSTLIIISAKHGDSPTDITKRRIIDMTLPAKIIGPALAYDQSDDGSVIWLKDRGQLTNVLAELRKPEIQRQLGVEQIFAGNLLKLTFGDPDTDPRVPDIILKTDTGVMFHRVTNTKLSENGGINEDDLHVALLVANPKLAPREFCGAVETKQIAPTILNVLGINPLELQAVRREETPVLPSLMFRPR